MLTPSIPEKTHGGSAAKGTSPGVWLQAGLPAWICALHRRELQREAHGGPTDGPAAGTAQTQPPVWLAQHGAWHAGRRNTRTLLVTLQEESRGPAGAALGHALPSRPMRTAHGSLETWGVGLGPVVRAAQDVTAATAGCLTGISDFSERRGTDVPASDHPRGGGEAHHASDCVLPTAASALSPRAWATWFPGNPGAVSRIPNLRTPGGTRLSF